MNRFRSVVKLSLLLLILGFTLWNPHSMTTPSGNPTADGGAPTLDQIREQIFMPTCASASCHSSQQAAGGLILDGYYAYGSLVDIPPKNLLASAAGKLRVAPGKPDNSFLCEKLEAHAQPGDEHHTSLPADKLQMIRDWISAGALPSSTKDITLPEPKYGQQVVVTPFQVPSGSEVQGNFHTSLTNTEEIRVSRFEMLYPPGSHHLNFFAYQGGLPNGPPPDGTFIPTFDAIPFANWAMRAGNQRIHMIWDLPEGVAFKFDPLQKVLAQIHFVNVGEQLSPIGGTAVINLHATPNPAERPILMGTMFGQNKFLTLPPRSTTIWDYGVTFNFFGIDEEVKLAAATGHFHWRGRTFEIRRWDGRNKNPDNSPVGCRPCLPGQDTSWTEFDRMGLESSFYRSDNWDEPPFVTYPENQVNFPEVWGLVYRATYVNNSNRTVFFGPHVEIEEHGNVFIYFYPGPDDGHTLGFPTPEQGGR